MVRFFGNKLLRVFEKGILGGNLPTAAEFIKVTKFMNAVLEKTFEFATLAKF
jgi:hypothetical protein